MGRVVGRGSPRDSLPAGRMAGTKALGGDEPGMFVAQKEGQ